MNLKQNKPTYRFFLIFATAVFFLSFFTGCVSTKNVAAPQITDDSNFIPEEFLWQPVAEGIERFDFTNPDIPVIYHAVKIDLSNENLELVCFPNKDTKHSASGKFTGLKTSNFARKNNCTVTINASPFSGRLLTKTIVGVHSFNKTQFSAAKKKYAAICFLNDLNTSGYKAAIIQNQDETCVTNFDFSFGGFFVVLKDSQVQNSFSPIYDSRSGAGISKDGKTLYLLVVEGENKNRSIGLSYPECGKIFYAMGCNDALELDGGGSTELCINGKSILTYKTFRIQANSFGFIEKQ